MQGKIYYGILIELLVYIAVMFHVSSIADTHLASKGVHDAVKSFFSCLKGQLG